MDWRHRVYFAVRIPSDTEYSYNKYMRLIKSIPTVKLHPMKYNNVKFGHSIFHPTSHSDFPDEAEPRGYYHVMVSVKGTEETKWLLAGLEMMCRDRCTGAYANYKEILPRSKR